MNPDLQIDFVIPHLETHEQELTYVASRPARFDHSREVELRADKCYEQYETEILAGVDRLEIYCRIDRPVRGRLVIELIGSATGSGHSPGPHVVGEQDIHLDSKQVSGISMQLKQTDQTAAKGFRIRYEPHDNFKSGPRILLVDVGPSAGYCLAMRLFQSKPNYCRTRLNRCIDSLTHVGIPSDRIFVAEGDRSASKNRNIGFSYTTAPWVCFTDDDVELATDFSLDRFKHEMHDENVASISPKILTDRGRIFCADPYFDHNYVPRPRGLNESDLGQYDYVVDAPWLPSTCLLVRREAFLTVGGFSEQYAGSQVEDVDFSLKLIRVGKKCRYVGHNSVFHYSLQRNDQHKENARLLEQTWGRLLPDMVKTETGSLR